MSFGRALVIDYTPGIVHLVEAVLQVDNAIARVDSASRGDDAVTLLDLSVYDVVILEAVVPFGEEPLLAYLSRKRPDVCRRTIVITAAPVAPALMKEIQNAGVYAVLDKPFDLIALTDAVEGCLRRRARTHALAVCIA